MTQIKPRVLLSTDTLPGYGLDHIFDLAKEGGFDGIDLAMWKNFDARNTKYVKKLVQKYELPVYAIQTSPDVTAKELQQAILLAQDVEAKVIAFNAPGFFNIKSYKLLLDGMDDWKEQFPQFQFAIITPDASSMTLLPVLPKYRFASVVEIIKRYHMNVGLDISHITDETRDTLMVRKLENMVPYTSIVYISDKNKAGHEHLPLGEGILPVGTFVEQIAKYNFTGYFSVKYSLDKRELADPEKVLTYMQRANEFIAKHYTSKE